MKKITKLFLLVLGLWASSLFVLSSCDEMNDIQQEYADREETVYLGKVDSISVNPGFGRAKITWYVSADPKIQRTVIYWNMRQDSIVKEIHRTESGVHKDSIIVENLSEGSTLFEFRNSNDRGEHSLYTTAAVTVWGTEYGDGLRSRRLLAFDYNNDQSVYNLSLSASTVGDSVVYSQLVYTNSLGAQRTVKIERVTDEVVLPNFPSGGTFKFRTVFFPPQGIDTVYSAFKEYSAPMQIVNRGTKIVLPGSLNSKYSEGLGAVLYEWNTNGDLITYAKSTNGALTQTQTYPGIAPRSGFRDLFFYDADRFIGVRSASANPNPNAVYMMQLKDGAFLQVGATPQFGTGFTQTQFMPTRGFFFSRDETGTGTKQGVIKVWKANNNATWGTPNGNVVGEGYKQYGVVMLYDNKALLAVDASGYMWSIPVSVSGNLGYKSRVGSGWNRFKKIFSVGTVLYGMEANGDIYVFNDFSNTDKFWVVD